MPSAKIHKRISIEYLGKYTPFIHTLIDASSKNMKHTHRAKFHDYSTIVLIEKMFGEDLALEALLHIIVDLESVVPNERRLVPYS